MLNEINKILIRLPSPLNSLKASIVELITASQIHLNLWVLILSSCKGWRQHLKESIQKRIQNTSVQVTRDIEDTSIPFKRSLFPKMYIESQAELGFMYLVCMTLNLEFWVFIARTKNATKNISNEKTWAVKAKNNNLWKIPYL